MKTAKALGLTVPQSILARADEAIEERLFAAARVRLWHKREVVNRNLEVS